MNGNGFPASGTELPRSELVSASTADQGAEAGDLDFRQILDALARRRRLAVAVLAASLLLGGGFTAYQRAFQPIFAGSFKLLVSDPINSEDIGSKEGGSIEQVALPGKASTNTGTLIQVLTSPMLLNPVEKQLGLPSGALGGNLSVATSRTGGDGVLEVNLQWRDPVEGQQILEEISRKYLAYSLRQRQEKLTQGLSFLDQQAPELQQRVNRLQTELSDFRRLNGFVEPEAQASEILGQRQGLLAQIEQLQQEQSRLEGRLVAVRRGQLGTSLNSSPALLPVPPAPASASGPQPVAPTVTRGDAVEPLTDLNAVEAALAEAQANFTESSPQVQELRAKRDRLLPVLQQRLTAELQADLSQNRSQQSTIQSQLLRLKDVFQANPDYIKRYEALQQQLEVARDNLSSYIKARENFRLQVAQRTVPWSVIAQPGFGSQPVAPSVPRNLLLSLLAGSLAGVGAALLRDRLDHVFHDPSELRQSIPLPLLGVVPHLPGAKGSTITAALQAMEGSEKFEIRESLRNLFANFRLLRADKTVRLVALTSATQGEGKSTTTALFAQTLAQMGQRILLVDADMRRPMLHRYIGAENGVGLSSLLTDSSLEASATVHSVFPGLDLLPAGPMPPDTTRLLSSERCAEVLTEIRALPGYDLVLFDTPPALLLSDPVLLAEHLDGLLFVVGLARVNRDLPLQALERMRGTGVDVLGVLANLASRRLGGAKRYGYGYGYGYGYSRYGGYQELANRYHNPDEGDTEAKGSEPRAAKSRTKAGVGKVPNQFNKVVNWLDRRD